MTQEYAYEIARVLKHKRSQIKNYERVAGVTETQKIHIV